ncbi:MAG: NADH-quinone oxidoreductase subunit K [Pyrodictiaceae archaeon]
MVIVWLAALLVALGTYGVLTSRNMLRVLVSIETVFNGVILVVLVTILSSVRVSPSPVIDASMLILFAIILTAVEVAVLASIILLLFRTKKSVMVEDTRGLRG